MPRTTSDEEVQLKKRARRRLVGAVVLATAVAVVLPMVLDTEPKPVSHNVNIQIPSPDSPAYAPKSGAPLPEPGKDAAPSAKSETAPARQDQPVPPVGSLQAPEAPKTAEPAKATEPLKRAESAKAGVVAKPAETHKESAQAAEPAKPPEAPKEPVKAAEAPKSGANVPAKDTKEAPKATPAKDAKVPVNSKFVVQVAALADTAKAKQLQQKMSAAGVKAYTEVVKTSKGSVTRVRAGPYDSREAAEKARVKLKSAGLDGKVVPR